MGGAASQQGGVSDNAPPRQQHGAYSTPPLRAPSPQLPTMYPYNISAPQPSERAQVTHSAPPQLTSEARPSNQLPAPSGRNHASASDDGVRACCKFRLRDLSEATQGFSSTNVIGEGGFGKVYRGTLLDGTQVAVKRLDPLSLQGDREYYAEIALLTRLRHPNLVCIMGMCNEEGHKLGVFEFMARGSLRDLLDKHELTWKDRISISIGIARGLAYLHEISEPPVIHCDFKSPNVLIDIHGQAHVADFGLARFIGGARPPVSGRAPSAQQSDVTTVTSIRGTYGYLSPEYLEQGHASVRADVFAFGVVLLELMTGQQAVDAARGRGSESLADWARPHLRQPPRMQAMLDPCVASDASAVQVAVLCEIAEACLRPNPRERPSMLEVIRTLSAASSYSEQQLEQPSSQQLAEAPAPPPSSRESPYRGLVVQTDASVARPSPFPQPHHLVGVTTAGNKLPGWSLSSPIGAAHAAAEAPTGSSRGLMPIESIQCHEQGVAEDALPVPVLRPIHSTGLDEEGRHMDLENLNLDHGQEATRASPAPGRSMEPVGLSDALLGVRHRRDPEAAAAPQPARQGSQGFRPSEPGQAAGGQGVHAAGAGAGCTRTQVSHQATGVPPPPNFPKLSMFGIQPP